MSKITEYFRRRDRGLILLLLAAASLLYLPFLGSPFVFDDLHYLNIFIGDAPKYPGQAGFLFDLRWLPKLSLQWTYELFTDEETYVYHAGNLLLHAASVIVLFYLLRQVIAAVVPGLEKSRNLVWGAWLAALAFALHPVAVYAVGYVIQRSILMATLFSLLMQMAYLRGILTGRRHWLALAVAAYFMAVFSKEHSVMMPAVLLALTLIVRDRMQVSRLALWATWGALAAVALFVILRAKATFGTPYEGMATNLFEQQGLVASTPILHLLSILTQAGLFFKYLWLWLLPNPAWMSVDMRELFIGSLTSWSGWLGAAGFLIYGCVSLLLLLRGGIKGLLGFALLYPWIQYWLEFSSIRVQEPFVLYRSYLWMPGLLLLIPLLSLKYPGKKVWFALGLAVMLLVPLAANRLWVFADTYRLWDDAARLLPDDRVPGADRIIFNRGQAAAAIKKWDEAIADFERVAAISPRYAPVRFQLGWAYGVTGRYTDAMIQFDAAIVDDPSFANAYYGKAWLLKLQHKHNESAALLAKACELKNPMACLLLKGGLE